MYLGDLYQKINTTYVRQFEKDIRDVSLDLGSMRQWSKYPTHLFTCPFRFPDAVRWAGLKVCDLLCEGEGKCV